MPPLSLPLSSLLKRKDCLQRANVFRDTLHGLHHRPFRPALWKRHFGAVVLGVGKLLSHHHPGGRNYAASPFSSSPGGQDMTEKLRSAYKQTKRQTEGTGHVLVAFTAECSVRPLTHSTAANCQLSSPECKPVMTDE